MFATPRAIWSLIGAAMFIVAASFYWFGVRPSRIRIACHKSALIAAKSKKDLPPLTAEEFLKESEFERRRPALLTDASVNRNEYEVYYKGCLRARGL